MSGTNHITGGIVFTGIFASFWNINIFARPELLAATGFFAILPDIDHLKSPIGKMFYPLAKFLDRRYGHRTITHSLMVYIPGIFLVMFLEKLMGSGSSYTLVFAFAYFSHLLFDMLTKQGIPLFYPFKRNPCVIPGNPEMRLRSSDLKTEAACFAIFVLLGITCQNLFANGFWNTYNRQFSDLKHLNQEAKLSETLLSVKYHFRNTANKEISGTGLLINSSEKEAILYSERKFVTITKSDRIITIEPTRSAQSLTTQEIFFSNISPDSLTNLINGKPLISLVVQSNADFTYPKEKLQQSGKKAELNYCINPHFDFTPKTIPVVDTTSIETKRKLLRFELSKELQRQNQQNSIRTNLATQISSLAERIPMMELYERETSTKVLARLKHEYENLKPIEDNSGKIQIQLQELRTKPQIQLEAIKISGYVNYVCNTGFR